MIKTIYTFLIIFMIGIISLYIMNSTKDNKIIKENNIKYSELKIHNIPPCLEMYYSIEKHAEKYNIPRKYAYGVAFKETGYVGPLDWGYTPSRISGAGAVGPMQIIPSTASYIWGYKVDKDKLKNNIDFNVETSMKYLAYLKNRYKDWEIVFGFYNTGYPVVNQYASDVYNYKIKKIKVQV